jgi:hypothetical protein
VKTAAAMNWQVNTVSFCTGSALCIVPNTPGHLEQHLYFVTVMPYEESVHNLNIYLTTDNYCLQHILLWTLDGGK